MFKYSMIRLISQRSGVYIINSAITNDGGSHQEYAEYWTESRLARGIGTGDAVSQVLLTDM
jgi:hypothetical protein